MNVMPEGFDALDPLSQKLWLITDMEMNRLRDDMITMADILIQITNAVCDLQEAGAAP
ncbi:hypothetical protein IFT67_12625 [Sphingomonas sp. CFBP 13728]|uniref:hypothetical protein n=1 Tax=Sphingomonas sp. CFBP 13728 TaxID=2775294 RepID=UPI001780CAD4|nr:hypothetical protein [Sphingomonas sp. CFBP 13728]MBD8619767.1 hypothetical protein [Sphingomonas sp. CFBP 13728]